MIDLTNIFQALILLGVAFCSAFVIPWIRSKTTQAQRQELQAWITIAVQAAEQIYKGSGRGEEKKQYVMDWLEDHGFYIEVTQLEAMLESAVLGLKGQMMG